MFVLKWSFPLGLIVIFSTMGLVWGQVGKPSLEKPEKPFLQPYSPVIKPQNLDASRKPINLNANRDREIGKAEKEMVTFTPKSPKPSLGLQQTSGIQSVSPKVGAGGSMTFQDYNRLRGAGSGSFGDGYFLKSLHEKRKVRRKAADNKTPEINSLKKNNSFIK